MLDILKEAIKSSVNKQITYEQFMNTVLYHEEKGYYMKEKIKVGKKGDFITSSNISNVYGRLFASIFHKLITLEKIPPIILEIGGGNGRFAKAILDELQNSYHDAYQKITYIIIETSPYHQRLQQDILPVGKKVFQYKGLDEARNDIPVFHGIVVTNELFDAFPVRVIEKKNNTVYEVNITLTEDEQLTEILSPLTDELVKNYVSDYKVKLSNGQRFEIPLQMLLYFEHLASFVGNTVVFTVDYGYTNDEWEDPARRKGSLRGYYKHQLIENPLEYPGNMDLTTHIHFDTLVSHGVRLGLEFVDKLRQDEFLLAAGILSFLEENVDPNPFSEKSKQNRAIRSLIMDGGMSSSFHVLIQQKNVQPNWDDILQSK